VATVIDVGINRIQHPDILTKPSSRGCHFASVSQLQGRITPRARCVALMTICVFCWPIRDRSCSANAWRARRPDRLNVTPARIVTCQKGNISARVKTYTGNGFEIKFRSKAL